MWHASLSLHDPRGNRIRSAGQLERAAVALLAEVGGDTEWWYFSKAGVGHLRVPVTPAEDAEIPTGQPVADAGESGPRRARTRPPAGGPQRRAKVSGKGGRIRPHG